ncbi:hypothetical protein [Mesorhizobium sp. A623]
MRKAATPPDEAPIAMIEERAIATCEMNLIVELVFNAANRIKFAFVEDVLQALNRLSLAQGREQRIAASSFHPAPHISTGLIAFASSSQAR